MRTSRLVLFLVILGTATASAASDPISIDPPSPDSHSSIRLSFQASTCAPDTSVTVDGARITVNVAWLPNRPCLAVTELFPVTVELGSLPGGSYQVVPTGYVASSPTMLTIRDVDTFRIAPFGDRITGGATILLSRDGTDLAADGQQVLFGDRAGVVLGRDFQSGGILVKAPPHDPGVVDVTVRPIPESGSTAPVVTAKSAFIYYDPAAPPDWRVLEPILFPISYEGPGAYGSRWSTEKVASTVPFAYIGANFVEPPCTGCSRELRGTVRIMGPSRPDGQRIWVVRGHPDLGLSSRIHNTSGAEDGAGTAAPVARESDFKTYFQIHSVPATGKTRTLLRAWALDQGAHITVAIPALSKTFLLSPVPAAAGDLPFGTLDLTDALAQLPAATTSVDIEAYCATFSGFASPRAWAMISVTNNETQEVSIFAP